MLHFNVLSEGLVFVKLQVFEYTCPFEDRTADLNVLTKSELAQVLHRLHPNTAPHPELTLGIVLPQPPRTTEQGAATIFPRPPKIAELGEEQHTTLAQPPPIAA
jgi:hypothetical protein